MRVYFDNAASTPILPEVVDAMLPHLRGTYGNPSSIHKEGRSGRALIERARKSVAARLNASIGEIFFTSGGTEAANTAIKCSVRDLGVRHIVSCPTEHHCVLHSLADVRQNQGVALHFVELDVFGRPSLPSLERLLSDLREERVLVSLMHANNETGNLIDLGAFAKTCREHGALFHSDTVQTTGHFAIDLQETQIDFVTGAAHKFHGPKGVGFLYVNNDQIVRPFVDGGSQERNMRGGTENLYGIVGLATAFDMAYEELAERRAHILELRSRMLAGLRELDPGLRVNTDVEGANLYTVLSVSFTPTPKAELLLFNLDIAGIAASGGSACSSGADAGSHVIKAIFGEDDCMITVRFSFSHLNTAEEVDYAVGKIAGFLAVPVPA